MRLRRIIGLALACAVLLAAQQTASAYSPHTTHRWIARKAIDHLVALYPGMYDELLEYADFVVDGAEHEDDHILDGDGNPLTLRVMRHFYRHTDGTGLASPRWGDFPSSYEWGVVGTEQNEWDYGDGLRHYRAGDKAEAYFIAGHVVHLIQDLTVPAHAHLDEHGPPLGDTYESYCADMTRSDFDASLRLPEPGTPLPEVESLEELWEITGSAAYWRNMYPGEIGDNDATGVIADMFPDLELSWVTERWTIPGVGTLGKEFKEEEPGYFYFKMNDAVPEVDRLSFDPFNLQSPEFGPNEAEMAMNARMAEDLVPIAVLHSAAVLKFFVDEARASEGETPTPGTSDESPLEGNGGDSAACSATGSAGSLLLIIPVLLWIGTRKD